MISKLFQTIEDIIPKIEGWCSVERASDLASLIVGTKPELSVCIGVWGGRDTFACALAHKYNNFGKVIGVDPWLSKISIDDQRNENEKFWGKQEFHDLVYNQFLENLKKLNVNDYIHILKNSSNDVESPREIGLLIVDGNHGSQAIRDVNKFAINVNLGGFCYMDDINWDGGNVIQAIKVLESIGFEKIYNRDTGAFFQRKKLNVI